MTADSDKKNLIEGIQALLVKNALEKDYLDAALDHAVKEDPENAMMFIDLAERTSNQDSKELLEHVREGSDNGRN